MEKQGYDKKSWGWSAAWVIALLLMLAGPLMAAEGARPNVNFNHDQTTFPLTGIHTNTACESCHINGVFKGTPNTCTSCHNRGTTAIAQTTKPANHMQTTKDCSTCHKTTGWIPALFDHSDPNLPACSTCHNGKTSTGKPAGHILTTKECGECHKTAAWLPAGMDHSTIVPPAAGRCSDCHGVTATGKPAKHVATGRQCDLCHATKAWIPATYIHPAGVANCQSCHNNTNAKGKSAKHLATADDCNVCHTTTGWLPTAFAHTAQQLSGKSCADCHNGKTAAGKPAKHLPTTQACDACHTTAGWAPTAFAHTAQQLSGKACADCHNGKTAAGKPAKHLPTTQACDACHTTAGWLPTSFAHAAQQLSGKACADCHNGKTATGKTANHISTTNFPKCDTCHTTAAWKPSQFAHQNVTTVSNCTTCHNGKNATGRPAAGASAHKIAPMMANTCGSCHTIGTSWTPTPMNHTGATNCEGCHVIGSVGNPWTPGKVNHISTSGNAQCSACHTTQKWKPATFSHKGITSVSNCTVSCHNGTNATGRPLAGAKAHTIAPMTGAACGSCHSIGGAWTPASMKHTGATSCTGCHATAGNAWTSPAKPNHISTAGFAQCSSCHSTSGWLPTKFAHAGITAASNCATCHDGSKASGKPVAGTKAHLAAPMTNNTCGSCHAIGKTWQPANMNHAGAIGCSSCHAISAAAGTWTPAKANHVSTAGHAECSDCHATTKWKPSKFSHQGVTSATDCTSCHNGTTATGRPSGAKAHTTAPMNGNACGSCHVIGGAWVPGTMNHAGATTCASCHAYTGNAWTVAKANHISTASPCSVCHVTSAWKPASNFDHGAAGITAASGCTASNCHGMTTKAAPQAGMPSTGTKAHKLAMVSANCGSCHSIGTVWNPASMNHSGATDCKACHSTPTGNSFTPAKANHISTAAYANCSSCHTSAAWKPTAFTHQNVTSATVCTTCHNGKAASGRPATGAKAHTVAPMNANTCGSCHTAGGGWVPAKMNHTGLTSCTGCHAISAAGNGWTPGKSGHIPTTGYAQCVSCHTTTAWKPAAFTHAGITKVASCTTCHNGTTATGRPIAGAKAHTVAPMSTSNTCGSCHAIGGSWTVTPPMNHAGLTSCTSCHAYSGNSWTPLKSGHVSTTAQCSSCHGTAAWLPVNQVNHAGFGAASDCTTSGCHNGTSATGRPTAGAKAHMIAPLTSNACGACHTPGTAWSPATMNHAGVTSCRDCHAYTGNGWTAAKANHVSTASQCSVCHATSAWKPASNFDHGAAGVSASSNCTGSGCHGMTTKAAPQAGMPTTGAQTHKLAMVSANCGSCHSIGSVWAPATMNHSSATDCKACHSTPAGNAFTPAKANHIATAAYANCSSCHTTTAWKPTAFTHQNVTGASDCTTCHNGTAATGRPATGAKAHKVAPMSTSKTCGSCHTVGTSWVVAPPMNHAGLTSCTGCHATTGNSWTPAKPGHISTVGYAQCSSCHSTIAWKPAAFTHTGITSASNCTTCHNGTAATGRPASGAKAHTVAPMSTTTTCGSCHTIGGNWMVTPPMNHTGLTSCTSCHATTGNSWTPAKAGHIATTGYAQCSSCHATTAWLPAAFAHTGVTSASNCTTCHNGTSATGRPLSGAKAHTVAPMSTTTTCASCHTIGGSWLVAPPMNHAGLTTCTSCHAYTGNGWTPAKVGHMSTTAQCSSCHATTAWLPATHIDHAGFGAATDCTVSGCHNGTSATGRPTMGAKAHAAAPMTSNTCGTCHTPGTVWTPATMRHAGAASCTSCHATPAGNGFTPAKANHISTAGHAQCSDCHTTTLWKPSTFAHQGITNATTCTTCHNGTSTTGRPISGAKAHTVAPMSTTTTCGSCHTVGGSWVVAPPMNHSGLTGCSSCHAYTGNGWTPAKAGHIVTSTQCSSCHATTAWLPASSFNHAASGITAASNCATAGCHNGTSATGRPATGAKAHLAAPMTSNTCGSCHTIGTVWTPATMNHAGATSCTSCHATPAGNGFTPAKANHISTTGHAQCSDCHNTNLWKPATFNHQGVSAATDCFTGCHNGTNVATTRPLGAKAHTYAPMTTNTCGTCHTIGTAWAPATMNHSGATTCTNCHTTAGNGFTPAKANHLSTAGYPQCSSCHTTTAWKPSSFNHSGVAAGSCANCHNGTGATGPTASHPANTIGAGATYKCDACHRTTAWLPATFGHSGVTAGCANCHKTGFATAPSATHFVTTQPCEKCHNVTAWAPIKAYSHTSPYYKAHPSLSMSLYADCKLCHINNSETISGAPHRGNAAYKPNCAWCHATQYKPGSHKKTQSPTTVFYTAAELQDCAGACHEYTNNTFTTIKNNRTGHHRSTDGGF